MTRIRVLSPSLLHVISGFVEVTGPEEFSRLCRSVAVLSHLFTRDRGALDAGYMADDALRRGYVAYFLPVNLGKVQDLLDELPSWDHVPASPVRVLDIGSGPGTAALAVLDWMRHQPSDLQRPIEAIAGDQAKPALLDAEQLWKSYLQTTGASAARLRPVCTDLERGGHLNDLTLGGRGWYDLIILANTLGELFCTSHDPVRRRAKFVQGLLDLLHENGTLMILEPAMRDASRNLHQLRNALLEERVCTVYSPCLHERPCPALVKEEDWCHEERPWTQPPLVAEIDKKVGFIKDALKFSYLLLRKDGRTIVQREPTVYRIVSELREMKGEKRAWLCNETGRPEVGRLDRDQSPANASLDEWHRGAIVRIDQIVRKDRKGRESTIGRIPDSATVEALRSV
ncbi:MAG: small ribosomal subunit Rsm22 family protein [bacterium]